MPIYPYQSHLPDIDPTAYIAPSADIIGKVSIGANSSIWPQTVIRGDVQQITIGSSSSIQDGSVLHVTHDGPYTPGGRQLTIGNHVTVGHQATLHACTLEDLCLIGIGSIVLDGAIIQQHVLLGAGSVVTPGALLEGGFLWAGTPAKKIRSLSQDEIDFFSYSAQHYVRLMSQYQ